MKWEWERRGSRIKLKNSKPQILNTLKHLAMWRENECRERDIPRNKLIRDDALINISYASSKTIDELKKIRRLPKNLSHKDLDQIIYIIQEMFGNRLLIMETLEKTLQQLVILMTKLEMLL
jgi:ribonuclease D